LIFPDAVIRISGILGMAVLLIFHLWYGRKKEGENAFPH